MKNLSIAKKLMAGLGACLLILLAFAGTSFYTQGRLSAVTTEIGKDRLPKIIALGDVRRTLVDYRRAEGALIIATSPAANNAALAAIEDATAHMQQQTAWLDGKLTNPKAIDTFARFKQDWAEYMRLSRPVVEMGKTDNNVQATALYNGKEAESYAAADASITAAAKVQSDIVDQRVADSDTLTTQSGSVMVVGVILVALAMLALLVLLIRAISAPLTRMTSAMAALSRGDMAADIPTEVRADEVGQLSKAMLAFRDQLAGAEAAKQAQAALICDSIGNGLDALAKGDLTVRVEAELTGPFAKLKSDYNGAIDALSGTLSAVSRSTAGIRTGSTEIAQASDDLSRRTEQQAASLEETAAAMDEITATVRETASGATRANQVVSETRVDAEEGGRVVAQAVQAMGGIERASSEISEIISVIDGIAFQTNLLALNAGVEAARAGDAGRGFAVVASEVRALAQRSAEAAKDVKTKIMASTTQVEAGVTLVNQTGEALQRIVGRIAEIDQLVSNITTSAEQQASGLQQVNTAVGEMDSVTQQNAAMVEESTAAARSLASEAEQLAGHVARFRLADGQGSGAGFGMGGGMGGGMGISGTGFATAAQPRATAPERQRAPAAGSSASARKIVARRPAGTPTRGALALAIEPDADDWSQF